MNAFADVAPGVLDGRVAVNIAELPQTEAIAVVAGVGESVHYHGRAVAVEDFTHATIELIVGDGGPERLLLVGDRLHVCHWRWRRFCCKHQ